VVLAVGVGAKIGMLDRVEMSGVALMLGFELVKSVGGIGIGAKKGLEYERQLGR
jgi:hypothetical protein